MQRSVYVFLLGMVLLTLPLWSATFSGTLTAPAPGGTSSLSWNGGPLTGTNGGGGVFTTCTSMTCDTYTRTGNVPSAFYSANPSYAVRVTIQWGSNITAPDLLLWV